MKDGDVNNEACMVVNGLVRSYYMNEGKDITSRLMDEGFIITSWISFYTRKPGNEFLETLEDTMLACVHTTIFNNYMASFRNSILSAAGRLNIHFICLN